MSMAFTRRSFCKTAVVAAGLICCAGVSWGLLPSADAASLGAVPTDKDKAVNDRLREKAAEYEEQIQPYRRDVELGETASLANIDADIMITNPNTGEQVQSKMHDFVSWDGTLDVTVDAVALYGSLGEAIRAQRLSGIVGVRSDGDDDGQVVVVQTTVTNVDATPGNEDGYFNVGFLAPMYMAMGATASDVISAALVAFDGAPTEALVNEKLKSKFILEQGQTKVFTTAWHLVVEAEPSTLCIRPSMNLNELGPIKFLLGLEDGVEGDA